MTEGSHRAQCVLALTAETAVGYLADEWLLGVVSSFLQVAVHLRSSVLGDRSELGRHGPRVGYLDRCRGPSRRVVPAFLVDTAGDVGRYIVIARRLVWGLDCAVVAVGAALAAPEPRPSPSSAMAEVLAV